jgi:hypothetical protein
MMMDCPKRTLPEPDRCKMAHHPNQLDFNAGARAKLAAKEKLKE